MKNRSQEDRDPEPVVKISLGIRIWIEEVPLFINYSPAMLEKMCCEKNRIRRRVAASEYFSVRSRSCVYLVLNITMAPAVAAGAGKTKRSIFLYLLKSVLRFKLFMNIYISVMSLFLKSVGGVCACCCWGCEKFAHELAYQP